MRLAPLRMSELPLADKWAVQKLKDGVRLASKDLHFRTEDESGRELDRFINLSLIHI